MAATIHPGLRLLVRKLERLGPLCAEGRRVLEALPMNIRPVDADRDLVREGDRPSHCLLLLEGFACRYKVLEDGRRQITSFHIPGDIVDLTGLLLGEMDHGISTLIPARVAPVPHAVILDWTEHHPGLARLLWRDTMVDASVFREWVVNVGRRTAHQRVAHLLCELVTRLHGAGLVRDHACDLPLTQIELADATGLSAVRQSHDPAIAGRRADRVAWRHARGAGLAGAEAGRRLRPGLPAPARRSGAGPGAATGRRRAGSGCPAR